MKSGIYQIKNIVDSNLYIGSTINFNERRSTHFSKLKRNCHHSIKLQNAVNKYGIENFEFIILEECKVESLFEKEQYYIDLLLPYYNVCLYAGGSRGRKSTVKQLGNLRRGWEKRAEELSKPVQSIGDNGEVRKTYNSITEAAKELGLFPQSIAFVCKGKQKKAGRLKWRYKI